MLRNLQIVLPLEEEPCKRSGKDPKQDSESYPIEGRKITSQTGEIGIVRREPDLQTLKKDLQVCAVHAEHKHLCCCYLNTLVDSCRQQTTMQFCQSCQPDDDAAAATNCLTCSIAAHPAIA